jgi:hypothetical protein
VHNNARAQLAEAIAAHSLVLIASAWHKLWCHTSCCSELTRRSVSCTQAHLSWRCGAQLICVEFDGISRVISCSTAYKQLVAAEVHFLLVFLLRQARNKIRSWRLEGWIVDWCRTLQEDMMDSATCEVCVSTLAAGCSAVYDFQFAALRCSVC